MSGELTRRGAGAGLLAIGLGAAAPAPAPSGARRVVSLNPCLDAILVHVADRQQIAALSFRSRDPEVSTIAALAASLPVTQETADEVLALKPDLVIASRRNALHTRAALKRVGLRVREFQVPEKVDASIRLVEDIAALVGREARGDRLVADIHAALARARPGPQERRLSALVYQSSGLTPGRNTLIGEMMERCGLENVAARYGLKKWGAVSLERLVADPPDLLLLGEPDDETPLWRERRVLHPVLAQLEPRMHRVRLAPRLLYCGGPVLIETAATLERARRETAALQLARR